LAAVTIATSSVVGVPSTSKLKKSGSTILAMVSYLLMGF
jgi:hypothetical protein